MKELIRFRQFLNEKMDPLTAIMKFVSSVRELLNDPKAGIHPRMLNYLLDEMQQFTPFLEIEEYMMHVEQAAESYQQDDMEGTKTHLLQALDSGETAYKDQIDQYLNEGKEKTIEGLGDGGIQDKMIHFAMGIFRLPGMNRILYKMATDPEAREFLAMSDEDIKLMFDEFNIKLPKDAFKK